MSANPASVAVYPKASMDSDGDRLNGKNDYIIHFDKDTMAIGNNIIQSVVLTESTLKAAMQWEVEAGTAGK